MHYTSAFTLLSVLDTPDGEVYARVRGTYAPHFGAARALPVSLITSALRHGGAADLFRFASRVDADVATEVLAQAGPAVSVLRFLRHTGNVGDAPYPYAMREVSALLDRHLGADPRAWARLVALLPDFPGTVAELVAAAGAGSGGGDAIPSPARGVAHEWRQLLLYAAPAHLAVLAPHLRPAVRLDLVRFGARLPRAIVADVVARATPRQRLALASAEHVRAETVGELVALRESALNTALFDNTKLGDYARVWVMAEAGTVALDPAVIARATSTGNPRYRRPGLWSGDPLLTRAALLRTDKARATIEQCVELWRTGGIDAMRPKFRDYWGPDRYEPFVVPRQRVTLLGALLALWDRHGVKEAELLVTELPLAAGTEQTLRARFAEGDAGRAALRAEFEQALAEPIGTRESSRVPRGFDLGAPGYQAVAWPALVAAHERDPLDAGSARHLTGFADCPEVIAGVADDGAALRTQWPAPTGWLVPQRRIAGSEMRQLRTELKRIPDLAERVFDGERPAEESLELYERIQRFALDQTLRAQQRERMTEYVRSFLGDGTDARVVAARMAPSFSGTLPELLATATVASG